MGKQTNGKRELPGRVHVEPGMADATSYRCMIEPGQWVRHPTRPEWGIGQVQSAIGARITVNFEHRGKVLINAAVVDLDVLG